MSWSDIKQRIELLTQALDRFDWDRTAEICAGFKRDFYTEPEPCQESDADRILGRLSRKRRFRLMQDMAETMQLRGLRGPRIRRRYAQALIEQGGFAQAEYVLKTILADQPGDAAEREEARGLLGRLYKQLYVNPGTFATPQYVPYFRRALEEYWLGYVESKESSYWNGINVVAMLLRADQDNIKVEGYPSAASLAQHLLETLQAARVKEPNKVYAYEVATVMEALIALGRFDEALQSANEYVSWDGADAFEIGSTERQLREVWRIDKDPRCEPLLSLLGSQLLLKQGGGMTLSAAATRQDAKAAGQLASNQSLEAVLGVDRMQTLFWYKLGLERCDSIARIETAGGKGVGTGWVLNGEDLAARWSGKQVLITNKHVISPAVGGQPFRPSADARALLPGEVRVNFQTAKARVVVDQLLWSSAGLDIDATIVSLKSIPKTAKPLTVMDGPEELGDPPGRVYIIGHPAGRDLEFSLNDNGIIGRSRQRLHYRAPTEKGSSGSPVFESEEWAVIALHHAGGNNIPMIDGSEGYAANEGIPMQAIRDAIAST